MFPCWTDLDPPENQKCFSGNMCVKWLAKGVIFFQRAIIVLELILFSISAQHRKLRYFRCGWRKLQFINVYLFTDRCKVNIITHFSGSFLFRCTHCTRVEHFYYNLLLTSKHIFISVAVNLCCFLASFMDLWSVVFSEAWENQLGHICKIKMCRPCQIQIQTHWKRCIQALMF